MLLGETHLHGYRIVAVLPCISGSDPSDSSVCDLSVVTYDEEKTWTVWPAVRPNGATKYPGVHFNSMAKALRQARSNLGWG